MITLGKTITPIFMSIMSVIFGFKKIITKVYAGLAIFNNTVSDLDPI